ncbi:MAG TPA: Hsp20/alpha crystallin family protein [Anaerolineales bacterium]|nr:Hsp20/alpha crystallin family protein [Anaerolineales bacterium]HLF01342.1 Hsp20/alpha crystallin family protein [Anaerolineales bacterium]
MLIRSSQIYAVYHIHARQPAWRPPTDVYETETELVVQIEIAGMRDGHFHLSVQDRMLIVHGSRADGTPERRAYHQMEVNSGDFWTEIELPIPVEAASARAEYDDGFLRINLPKVS